MNVYPDRISELHTFLESVYGQRDRQATEILLASILDSAATRRPRPWVIVETDYLSRDTTDAWFAFGGAVTAWPLSIAKVIYRQKQEQLLQEWIGLRAQGATGVFVEAEWQRLLGAGRGRSIRLLTSSYRTLMSMCVRLRVEYPKNGRAARTEDERESDRAELKRLTSRVVDSALRVRHYNVLSSSSSIRHDTQACSVVSNLDRPMPDSLLYWCEMLQRVAPLQSDWEPLVANLVGIASGIACLHNDGRDPDWLAAERVLRDCVPYPISRLFGRLWDRKVESANMANGFDLYYASGDPMERPVTQEVKRLAREHVLEKKVVGKRVRSQTVPWTSWRMQYTVKDPVWRELLDREKRILV